MQYVRRKSTRLIFKFSELKPEMIGDLADAVRSAAEEYKAILDYKHRLKSARTPELKAALQEAIKDEEHHYQNFLFVIKGLTGEQNIEPADLPKIAASLQEWGAGPSTVGVGQKPEAPYDDPSQWTAGVGRGSGGAESAPETDTANPDLNDEHEALKKLIQERKSKS